ncbi:ribonucleases P/MRP protein subunit POP1 isoform X2 [Halyomorpha halys]|uniref:ribonucleases P/MRP protein subunit POP1 isoform X2 n=1 Tax=Halyomorpha halys TaxID=286706 RepID=UPI0006D50C15|nr:ribonucleases P/MRP protein subunit POP1 isoform X2 [Halyomorpha halys]
MQKTPSNNIFLKHQFPKHMRRRAMSQNVKRIPKRLREHQIDMREKSGIRELPIKRPRRKYRRRPQNLLSEYNRRQREFVWLETHIWHAKRFHMVEKWGYKLPHFPNDKCYRACYRATTKHCLIQDISFYCCIELRGLLNDIVEGLENHTSTECGLTFGSIYNQSGKPEGHVTFFKSGKYPYEAIGEISYIWQPCSQIPATDTRVLWLWSHPSFYSEILEELIKSFSFELEENQHLNLMEEDDEKNVEAIKLELKNIPFAKCPKYKSKVNSVEMILLKDTLNRFRLTGPLSQSLITSVFKEIDLSKRTSKDWTSEFKDKIDIIEKQLSFWDKIKNIGHSGELPSKLVFGLIAVDPRLTMPAHRNKVDGNISDSSYEQPLQILSIEEGLSYSPLWFSHVRDEVSANKLSTQHLNKLRSEKLIPGLEVELKNENINDFPAVPCLFIQRPGTYMDGKPLGYSGGWDIIVPAGYGQPVWLGLVMHGGRAGGLKETASILREAGMLSWHPDTAAGRLEDIKRKNELTEKFYRLPPAKRPNYVKLGFPTPFHCPWNVLINDWTDGAHESFFVLRNIRHLLSLKNKLKKIKDKLSFEPTPTMTSAIVGVMITLKGKGNLENNAYICIPTKSDLEKLKANRNFSGPFEEKHRDVLKDDRKSTSDDHKKLLKKLSRRRRKNRNQGNVSECSKSDEVVSEHSEVMKRLWLPECTTVKEFGCRTVLGFVVNGDFSFTSAKSSGVGYVCFKGLLTLLQVFEEFEKHRFILVRNHNSLQYRFATIKIIC